MNNKEIEKVLDLHKKWILGESNGMNANLMNVYLRRADLREADLKGANFNWVNSDIGWKKGKCNRLIKLLIPEDALRVSSTGRKCRASKAVVLDIIKIDTGDHESLTNSIFDDGFIYEVGKEVVPKNPFDENRWNECSSGIHFFITREEAEAY